MTRRFIARLLLIVALIVAGWWFMWDEVDRARWWKWFKNGGF